MSQNIIMGVLFVVLVAGSAYVGLALIIRKFGR